MKRILAPALAALALCSCSVKEDRAGCPCWLAIHFDRLQGSDALASRTGRGTLAVCIFDSMGQEDSRLSISVNERTSPVMVKVPRADLTVTATLCPDERVSFSSEILTRDGSEPDSLYAFSQTVNATGEEASVDLDSYKQFSTVHVRFEDSSGGHGEGLVSTLRFSLVSGSSGFDVTRLSPLDGRLEFALSAPDPEGRTEGRILRQKGRDISLLGYGSEDGRLRYDFQLRELIEKTGFDWNARSLDDIFVVINLTSGVFGLSVDGWDGEFLFSHIF